MGGEYEGVEDDQSAWPDVSGTLVGVWPRIVSGLEIGGEGEGDCSLAEPGVSFVSPSSRLFSVDAVLENTRGVNNRASKGFLCTSSRVASDWVMGIGCSGTITFAGETESCMDLRGISPLFDTIVN